MTLSVFEEYIFHVYDCRRGSKLRVPAGDITKMVLELPDGPVECNDETKLDFETMMIDPLSGDIYLIQKNIFRTDVNLYKVIMKCLPFKNSSTASFL